MTYTVAVAGASGIAAGEILRLVLAHPELEVGALTAASSAGTTLGQHHPHLRELADAPILETTPANLAGADLVVLGLPHGASGEIAAALTGDAIVLDLGADHRLASAAAWEEYYHSPHAGTWAYGMPELLHAGEKVAEAQREILRGATRIAVPGCNVTAVTLGLQPGVATGLLDPSDLVAVLANGYTGAGRSLKPHLLAVEAFGNATPYQVGGVHRHIPEIEQNLRTAGADDFAISFTPTLVPMARGILATASARLADDDASDASALGEALRETWTSAYADEPFVQVLPEGAVARNGRDGGANTALIQLAYDAKASRVVTVTAIDNLVKGTAGAAIQSLNLALGLAETTGLTTSGVK